MLVQFAGNIVKQLQVVKKCKCQAVALKLASGADLSGSGSPAESIEIELGQLQRQAGGFEARSQQERPGIRRKLVDKSVSTIAVGKVGGDGLCQG